MKFLPVFLCVSLIFIGCILGSIVDDCKKQLDAQAEEIVIIKTELVIQHGINKMQFDTIAMLAKAQLEESQLNALPHHEPIHNY